MKNQSSPTMTRRFFLRQLSLSTVVLSAPTYFMTCQKKKKTPNIVMIFADDMSPMEIEPYPQGKYSGARTPHLNKMAAEGVMYQTCYVMPRCSPSRVSLFSGRYPFRSGIVDNGPPLAGAATIPYNDDNEVSMVSILRSKGYRTALSGKWHVPGWRMSTDAGFDETFEWVTVDQLPEDAVYEGKVREGGGTSRYWQPCIIRWNREENQRVFVKTGTEKNKENFGPWLYSEYVCDFMDRYKNSDQPFFIVYSMVLPHGDYQYKPGDLSYTGTPDNLNSHNKISYVEYMDKMVGKVLDKITNDPDLSGSTYVFFSSDNGHGGWAKGTGTEKGAQAAMIVRGPEISSGMVKDTLIDITDIFPTLAEIAGYDMSHQGELDRTLERLKKQKPKYGAYGNTTWKIDGKSFFKDLINKDTSRNREWIFSCIRGERIVRTRHYLLERNRRDEYTIGVDGLIDAPFGNFYYCADHRDGYLTGERFEGPNAHYVNLTTIKFEDWEPRHKEALDRFVSIIKENGLLRVDCEAITQTPIEGDLVAPQRPSLISPKNGETVKNRRPILKWTPVKDLPAYPSPRRPLTSNPSDWEKYKVNHGLSRYQIQIDRSAIIDVPAEAYAAMWQTTEFIPDSNLAPGKHEWHVRAVDNWSEVIDGSPGNKSAWSPIGEFFVK